MENQEFKKHLVNVIDEAISEIEELKKSKFAAQEVKIDGPGEDGIAGMKADGKIEKEEDDEMDKADGKNNEADPSKGDFKQSDTVGKAEDSDEADDDEDEKKKKDVEKADGKNNEADPSKGDFKQADTVGKAEDDDEDEDDDMDKSRSEEDDLGKSVEASEKLMKSYVDDKFSALEKSIAGILDSVKALADQPAPSKGVQVGEFAALKKSNDETFEPLNKSYVANKLFDLKKSGDKIDSADIIKVETGSQNDIAAVATKYGLVKREGV